MPVNVYMAKVDAIESWLAGNSLVMADLPRASFSQRLWVTLRDNDILNQCSSGSRIAKRPLVVILHQNGLMEDPQRLAAELAGWRNGPREVFIVLVGGTLLRRHVAWCDLLEFVTPVPLPFNRLLIANTWGMIVAGNNIFLRPVRYLSRIFRRGLCRF